MYRQYPFSEQKQRNAKFKERETDPTWRRDWLFPDTKTPSKEVDFTRAIAMGRAPQIQRLEVSP